MRAVAQRESTTPPVALHDQSIEQMVAGFHVGPRIIAELERRWREAWQKSGRRFTDLELRETAQHEYRRAVLKYADQCLREMTDEGERLGELIHTARDESRSLLMYPLIAAALDRCMRIQAWLMQIRVAIHNAQQHGRGRDDLAIALQLMTAAGDALEHSSDPNDAELLREIRQHETRCQGSVIGGGE